MRGCFKAAMAFGMVVALAGPAMAQNRGGFGGGMGGPVNLLGNPGVQKELKLDETQVEKATALVTETRDKMMGLRDQLQGLQGEELQTKRAELAKPINEAAMKKVKELLKEGQFTRLTQIELQQRGASALTDPAIAKKLKVTDEQSAKVKTILADQQAEIQEIRTSAGTDAEARRASQPKITAIRKETNTKVMALMSDDQKKSWKEMTGDPYEVVYAAPAGR
jgi:hypothetical protein